MIFFNLCTNLKLLYLESLSEVLENNWIKNFYEIIEKLKIKTVMMSKNIMNTRKYKNKFENDWESEC